MNRSSYLALIRKEKKGPGALLLRSLLWLLAIPYSLLSWSRNRLFDLGWRRTWAVASSAASARTRLASFPARSQTNGAFIAKRAPLGVAPVVRAPSLREYSAGSNKLKVGCVAER